MFYHLERRQWLEWDYDIDKYDICGDIIEETKHESNLDDSLDQIASPSNMNNYDDDEDMGAIEYQNLSIVT